MPEIIKGDRVPLYYQLMDIIIDDINNGKYKENDKLPSERELCQVYDISRATVRQTILELEKEGYVYKQHGKGTFVSGERFKQDLLKIYSFTEEMKKLGKKPFTKVLDFAVVRLNERMANKMNMKEGSKVYKIKRLRLAGEKPMMVETSYIPYDRFMGLKKEDLEQEAMYDIFIKRYNAVFTKAEESFRPVLTREEEAKLLKNVVDSPSMMVERITFEGNNIIEYTVSIARGDKFKYRVVLEK
ncbi:GntR family transcriptional regulator [Clostridiaceae bacterium M8S5]|nr:GntR family transcriptional regulator [Clostridiaceae bacterium M8S5]